MKSNIERSLSIFNSTTIAKFLNEEIIRPGTREGKIFNFPISSSFEIYSRIKTKPRISDQHAVIHSSKTSQSFRIANLPSVGLDLLLLPILFLVTVIRSKTMENERWRISAAT